MTKLRSVLSVATALAVALPAMVGAAQAQTQIQVWHAFSGRLGELIDKQIADFNESQDEYEVVGTYKGNYTEALNAGIAAFRANEQPHILQVFEVGTATMMAAKGAIKPVYEVMAEAKEPFDPNAYLAAVAGYYTTADGEMLSLPYNSSTTVMYLNKDALEKAGLDPESRPKTWPELEELLVKLKESGSACPFTTTWQSWVHLENLSAYHDLPFATKSNGFEGTDTELVFNDDLHVKHISMLAEWVKNGLFKYGGRSEPGALFRSGECAVMTESSAGYAGVKAEASFPFTVTNLPYWPDVEGAPFNTIIGGASLWVMAGHEAEEYVGVAKFLTYMSSPEVQAQWHQDTGYLPITTAAYDLTKEQGFYEENPGTDIAILQMTGKAPTANSKGIRLGNFDQIRTVIDEELEAVWQGEKDVKAALDEAVARGNELLRRFEQTAR
ncbi:carbohydrate ABC transporter substrate-binding protein (CUT1 family) [Mesorhizobium sp. J18]|uniref:sn-glycerol-3-phosphate ABC transporter substrate-binding protein UgpB n=1 Tax=Mesorhizobium sp. J18 TaxID=935263 RepID=UPI00119994CC|nr:sn-glycerol-3-phosphate ABC transporter substrate-binding protein UgpB [Mesorhizobium sp. J18]TWG99914.1 carbohydrate ABC transporter substrate-binding protein (CUT1 family) [Mesorhizobium sp. J18]